MCKASTARSIINVGNFEGTTALIKASIHAHTAITEVLLEHRADLEVYDSRGRSAMMLAAANGFADTLSHLISAGASITVADSRGWNAFMHAVAWGNRDCAALLLRASGADICFETRSLTDQTALDLAHAARTKAMRECVDMDHDLDRSMSLKALVSRLDETVCFLTGTDAVDEMPRTALAAIVPSTPGAPPLRGIGDASSFTNPSHSSSLLEQKVGGDWVGSPPRVKQGESGSFLQRIRGTVATWGHRQYAVADSRTLPCSSNPVLDDTDADSDSIRTSRHDGGSLTPAQGDPCASARHDDLTMEDASPPLEQSRALEHAQAPDGAMVATDRPASHASAIASRRLARMRSFGTSNQLRPMTTRDGVPEGHVSNNSSNPPTHMASFTSGAPLESESFIKRLSGVGQWVAGHVAGMRVPSSTNEQRARLGTRQRHTELHSVPALRTSLPGLQPAAAALAPTAAPHIV